MSTLTKLLRDSTAEICALAVGKGEDAGAIASNLDALLEALDGADPSGGTPSSVGRAVGMVVLDWLETRDAVLRAREVRILHEWISRASSAHIRELTEAAEAAARGEERLRFILSNARIRVGELDRDLRFRWVHDPSQLPNNIGVGQGVRDFAPPVFADALGIVVDRVMQSGKGERVELSTPSPTTVRLDHLLLWIEPTRDAEGTVRGVLLATADVTELKEAEIALAQAAVFRERMVAVLAHDLRNPLSSIVALARLHARKEDLPPRTQAALVQMERAAGRMVELIGTILDFSVVRFGGAFTISRASVDLHHVATEVLDELRSAASERSLELRTRGDTRGAWDSARMAQVVSNLVGNALVHGAPGKPIVVELEGDDGRVRLRVTNRGPIIPPDDIELLFEPFRRGRDAGPRSRGLGLGLYIVREIVRAHDGRIQVESSAERGTVFTLDLPRSLAAKREPAGV